MLTIAMHKEPTNPNKSEISPHTNQNGYYQKEHK